MLKKLMSLLLVCFFRWDISPICPKKLKSVCHFFSFRCFFVAGKEHYEEIDLIFFGH